MVYCTVSTLKELYFTCRHYYNFFLFFSIDGEISIDIISKLISPNELLSCCYNFNEQIRNCAAKRLRKLIQKNILSFCSDDHLQLQTFEKQTRSLLEKHDSHIYIKLYFWISVAIFFRIYKSNDLNLKMYMKKLTLTKWKNCKQPYDQLCQQVYFSLSVSLHAKMKAWPNRLDSNNHYVKKFESCLAMIDVKSLKEENTPSDALIKILSNLPWDMKHIFIVAISEKVWNRYIQYVMLSYTAPPNQNAIILHTHYKL